MSELTGKSRVCSEILEIMKVYHEQESSSFGVDTPGGLEHMGDVWRLFQNWEGYLESDEASTPHPHSEIAVDRDTAECLLEDLESRYESPDGSNSFRETAWMGVYISGLKKCLEKRNGVR